MNELLFDWICKLGGLLLARQNQETSPNRGRFFIDPQTDVYSGQIVGEHSKEGDLVVNVTKSKKLTNVRASGSDEKVR